MRRRSLLATSIALGSGLVAGCLGSPDGSSDTTTTTSDSTIGCPRYEDRISEVVCTPDIPDPDATMSMQPASAAGSLPTADFTFTLENRRDSTYQSNFYAWRLQKYVDGTWYHVTPYFWPEPMMQLPPGERHTWELAVDNSDLDRSIPHPQGSESMTVVGLGSGTYSFGVAGRFEGDPEDALTAFLTRFELSGAALDLGPTPDIADRQRDGDRVVLTWRADDGDPRTYRVTRLPSVPGDATRVIPEQAIRIDPLRNALSMFEQWSRIVEIRTSTGGLSGRQFEASVGTERTIQYGDTGYRIDVEKRD